MADSSDELTEEEKVLLHRYHEFYRSLETGRRSPTTAAQVHFVAVCQGRAKAETVHEKAYAKYLRIRAAKQRREREEEQGRSTIPEYEEGYPRPGWFTDDDWEKMRSRHYRDMRRRYLEE